MTLSSSESLRKLETEYPEWKPWIGVLQEVVREANDHHWGNFVPETIEPQQNGVPLLSGKTIAISESVLRPWAKRLMITAARSGAPNMAGLEPAGASDVITLFRASLCHDAGSLQSTAEVLRVDPQAFKAVAVLLAVPFLNACNRAWSQFISKSWLEGYCPVCGAWPAFAEVRGIERSRYFRCGRCASAWEARCLFCPFCGMLDHDQLGSLVPERSEAVGVVEVCKRCLGYVKTFTLLQPIPPDRIVIQDLASVALDVAALNEGNKRPEALGYAIHVDLVAAPTLIERILPWRT